MAKIEVEVCDTCMDPKRPVKTYTIERDGKKATTTRCAPHGRLFEQVFNEAAAEQPKPRRRQPRVQTVDEIEKAKKK